MFWGLFIIELKADISVLFGRNNKGWCKCWTVFKKKQGFVCLISVCMALSLVCAKVMRGEITGLKQRNDELEYHGKVM